MTSENLKKNICVLHKLLQHEKNFNYNANDDAHGCMNSHHSNSGLTATRNTRPTADSTEVRDISKEYSVSQGGALEWQGRMV